MSGRPGMTRTDFGPPIPAEPFRRWLDAEVRRLEDCAGITDACALLAERLGHSDRWLRRYRSGLTEAGTVAETFHLYPVEDALWRAGLHVWELYPAEVLDAALADDQERELAAEAEAPAGRRRGKQPGRWGKLTDSEVLAAHVLYDQGGLSLRELGAKLWERFGYATPHAAANSLSGHFKRLGLPTRDRVAATVRASTTHGLAPRGAVDREHRAKLRRASGEVRGVRCAGVKTTYPGKGRPCVRPALAGSTFCAAHDPARDTERRERLAAARAIAAEVTA